jgi:adenine/guanine phosphoribosyltransferase-like PRPP-binding protein
MNKSLDGTRILLEKRIPKLKSQSYVATFDSYEDWLKEVKEVKDYDQARNVLYAGFQPLFDALLEVKKKKRNRDITSLEKIIDEGTNFLYKHYTGKTRVKYPLKKLHKELTLLGLSSTALPYKQKTRNVDRNGIYSNDIAQFVSKACANDGVRECEVLLACACGSSEMCMLLSKVLDIPLYFIRKSKRRGDPEPVCLKEHTSIIKSACKGKKVLCVEDYVCSGNSLYDVMKYAESAGAISTLGASVKSPDYQSELNDLKMILKEKNFALYTK